MCEHKQNAHLRILLCNFTFANWKTNTIYQVDCLGFHLRTVYIHESNVRGSTHHLFLQHTYFFEALLHKFKKLQSNSKLSPWLNDTSPSLYRSLLLKDLRVGNAWSNIPKLLWLTNGVNLFGTRQTHQFCQGNYISWLLWPEWFHQSKIWTFFSYFKTIKPCHLRKSFKPKGILKRIMRTF